MPKVKLAASTPKTNAPTSAHKFTTHHHNTSVSSATATLSVKTEPGEPATWPSNTDLVRDPNATNKRPGIKAQSDVIQQIMKRAIERLEIYILLEHSFPDTIQKSVVVTAMLMASAKDHPNILARLKGDMLYLKDFGSVVQKFL